MTLRALAATVLLTLVACPSSSADITYPTGADRLVLRIETAGGLVSPGFAEGQIPQFSLFGDGRIITTGAQIEIYPQPALPPVLVRTVDPAGMQEILRAALAAGLGTDADYRYLGMADAPTTTFTLAANGQTHTVRVYALGELSQRPPGMSDREFGARSALQSFSARMGDLERFLKDGSVTADAPYVPRAMRVFATTYVPDPNLPEPQTDWPGSTPLGALGEGQQGARCGVVTGDDLAALMPLAERANQLTPWMSGGTRWSLVFRPLLPDESGC
ncbi:MAG: hypothetical protein HY240_10240 [Actinobacteria bacterium]|nr:hypothetical protein [Actinomycetota bacterium]